MPLQMPEGKFISIVKVGEKGQIVIPKGARDLFGIQPGDALVLLADKERGIAIVQSEPYLNFADAILDVQGQAPKEGVNPAEEKGGSL